MICIPIIAGEGGSDNAKKLEKGLAGRCLTMRGAAPPVPPSALPEVGAQLPKQVARLGFYPQSGGRSAPPTPGDFPVAGKVTKGAPRAAPFGIPRCVVAALFALAPLCSGSRRATFCHRKRPICHFEVVRESVLFFSLVLRRKDFVLLIRGAGGWVARLGATLGLNGV